MSDQLAKLNRSFDAVLAAVRGAVQPTLIKEAEKIAEQMRNLAPEFSGALKDSIAVTPGGQTTPPYSQPGGSRQVPENAVAITAGDTYARYPHLVEYGAEHAPAQPYFWPAWRLARKNARRNVRRAITKAVKDEWAK